MLLEEIKNIKSAKKDLRNFGLTVGIALGLIGAVLWWLNKGAYPYFIGIGALLIVAGLAIPVILKPLQKVWMTIAVVMGWIMARVILTLLFYLVFTLTGLVARLFGKDFLDLKRRRDEASYWNRREPEEYDPKRSEMQF